jgi:hypothetical protein
LLLGHGPIQRDGHSIGKRYFSILSRKVGDQRESSTPEIESIS